MNAKKLFSLILAALMLSSSFIACSETTVEEDTSAASADAVTPGETETETADPDARLDSGLEQKDFDDYAFHVYTHTAVGNDFVGEEITGESINDAQYERIITISDNCGVTIEYVENTGGMRDGHVNVNTAVMAGTNDYDLISLSVYSMCNALTDKLLVDLNTVGNIDLTQPWWDQRAVEDFNIAGHVYMATGDISIYDNNPTFCVYFNKDIATNYGMPNFYDMVNEKTWTIDNFKIYAEQFGGDTDNDGNHVNDIDDEYGIYIWDDIMMGIVNAGGIKCAEVDDDPSSETYGQIQLTLYSEKLINLIDKFASYAFDKDITCAFQRHNYDQNWGQIAFMEDRALFYMHNIGEAPLLREMETDFGILPLPLYEETQENYINGIASWGASLYAIPRNAMSEEEFARTGYITEYLAYEGMYTLTPAYYEKTLKGKASRDEESQKMLDLIFSTRAYDFGWYLEIGAYNESIMGLLRNYSTDVTSMYNKAEKVANHNLKRYNKELAKLAEQDS